MRSVAGPLTTGAMADFIREASVRLGISRNRLETAVRASQDLSEEELEVIAVLLDLVRAGTPLPERLALSRGILSAIETVRDAARDPLADVDDPMDAEEAARELSLAEKEAQDSREEILRDSISSAEAARLTGRSRQVIERLRRESRLLALRSGRQWKYPKWQFDPDAQGGVLPGLAEAIDHLGLSPSAAALWFLEPSARLGGEAPVEHLRRHRPESVIQLAWEQSLMP